MKKRSSLLLIVFATAVTAACQRSPESATAPGPVSPGSLQTLVDMTTGLDVTTGQTGTWNWAGQSFTVPGTGTFADIRFHWYSFQRNAAAFGTLYLLDREYLGLPRDLGSATPGYLGKSEQIADGAYVFPSNVTITGGAKYWVYTDTQGSFAGSFDQDIYPNGDLYLTGYPANPFRKVPASGRMINGAYVPPPAGVFLDANFKLQARAR